MSVFNFSFQVLNPPFLPPFGIHQSFFLWQHLSQGGLAPNNQLRNIEVCFPLNALKKAEKNNYWVRATTIRRFSGFRPNRGETARILSKLNQDSGFCRLQLQPFKVQV
jgi:hypothetical protein